MEADRGSALLALARGAIAERLGFAAQRPVLSPQAARWLEEPGATFVTLQMNGELRGCVGSLAAQKPIREDVEVNAIAAAFKDPRFPSLSKREYPGIEIEVSVLSPLEKLAVKSQSHLLTMLRPGVDGVVLEYGWQRGTFLPQVWEQLPSPETFLTHLKQKAGLPPDFWSDAIQISRYTVAKWREHRSSLEGKPESSLMRR